MQHQPARCCEQHNGQTGNQSSRVSIYWFCSSLFSSFCLLPTLLLSDLGTQSIVWLQYAYSSCQLVLPINLRASKALPRNCSHRPLVGRRMPGAMGFYFILFLNWIVPAKLSPVGYRAVPAVEFLLLRMLVLLISRASSSSSVQSSGGYAGSLCFTMSIPKLRGKQRLRDTYYNEKSEAKGTNGDGERNNWIIFIAFNVRRWPLSSSSTEMRWIPKKRYTANTVPTRSHAQAQNANPAMMFHKRIWGKKLLKFSLLQWCCTNYPLIF